MLISVGAIYNNIKVDHSMRLIHGGLGELIQKGQPVYNILLVVHELVVQNDSYLKTGCCFSVVDKKKVENFHFIRFLIRIIMYGQYTIILIFVRHVLALILWMHRRVLLVKTQLTEALNDPIRDLSL